MPLSFLLYLDLIRFFAALIVFLAYMSLFTKDTILWKLENYGDISVTIFSILLVIVVTPMCESLKRIIRKQF